MAPRPGSRLSGPDAAAGPFPDLVLSADTCLLVRRLSELASPADGERLVAEVRAAQQQAALCWLLVVGRRRAAASDADNRSAAPYETEIVYRTNSVLLCHELYS